MIELVDHTGELEMLIRHPTLAGVYGEALRGLAREVVGAGAADGERRPVAIDASGPDTLLADLLNEAVFLMETESFVPSGLDARVLDGGTLRGELSGRTHRSVRPVVKAATYHGLRVWREGGEWRGRVVLDV